MPLKISFMLRLLASIEVPRLSFQCSRCILEETIVPFEKRRGGPIRSLMRKHNQPVPVVLVVHLPVLELFLDLAADLNPQIIGDRQIPLIIKDVEIGAQQQPI